MTREDFLRELAYMLQDVAEEEREEALAYYRDYLEDAGPEAEQEVLRELGSPAQVAATIKAGLGGSDQGEFSEKGYGDPRYQGPMYPPGRGTERRQRQYHHSSGSQEAYEPGRGKGAEEPSGQTGRRFGKMSGGMIALLMILCILASPMILAIGLGVGSGILGVLVGLVCTVLGLMLAVGLMALGFLIGGVICLGGGIFGWVFSPLGGAAACFVGVALLGLALLTLALAIWFYGTAVPAVCRWVGRGFRKLFGGRRRGGETA